MPVDWKAPDSFTRLLAATVASLDGSTKLNYKKIADYYGEGATYDAIEGRFRNIKKQATKLKEEVESGRPIAPERGNNRSAETTPRKPKTPKNQGALEGVLNGRVTKSNNTTPTKKRSNAQVKREMMETGSYNSAASSASCTDVETPSSNDSNNPIVLDESFDVFSAYTSFDPASGGPQNSFDHNGAMHNDFWADFEHVA